MGYRSIKWSDCSDVKLMISRLRPKTKVIAVPPVAGRRLFATCATCRLPLCLTLFRASRQTQIERVRAACVRSNSEEFAPQSCGQFAQFDCASGLALTCEANVISRCRPDCYAAKLMYAGRLNPRSLPNRARTGGRGIRRRRCPNRGRPESRSCARRTRCGHCQYLRQA